MQLLTRFLYFNFAGLESSEIAKDGTVWEYIQPGAQSQGAHPQNVFTETAGPTAQAKCNIEDALSAFLCLVDRKMLQHIRDCTVAESHRVDQSWDLSVPELKAFIALLYVRGAYSKNLGMQCLWSEEWGLQFFRSTMPRDRFREIMRYLCVSKNSEKQAGLCTDKFAPFSDVWSGFVDNCTACYKPGAHISVGEQLLPTRAQCSFAQYLFNKHSKFGIRFWLAVDVDSKYLLNGLPHLWKCEARSANQRLGERAALTLLESYVGRGRNVTTDRFFTSLNPKTLQQNRPAW